MPTREPNPPQSALWRAFHQTLAFVKAMRSAPAAPEDAKAWEDVEKEIHRNITSIDPTHTNDEKVA